MKQFSSFSEFYTLEERDYALPMRVTSIGINKDQKKIVREQGYSDYHIFYCVEGLGYVKTGNRQFLLGKGMVMLLYPDEPHEYYPKEEPWQVDWITFSCVNETQMMQYLGFTHSGIFSLKIPGVLMTDLQDIIQIAKRKSLNLKGELSCQVYKTLINLSYNVSDTKNNLNQIVYDKVEFVLKYIEKNYSHPLSLELLAEEAGVSPQYLCLLFARILHKRPFRYINIVRINKSKLMLLENKSERIANIATNCGFDNISYFNQVFKKLTGMSPSEFRALH